MFRGVENEGLIHFFLKCAIEKKLSKDMLLAKGQGVVFLFAGVYAVLLFLVAANEELTGIDSPLGIAISPKRVLFVASNQLHRIEIYGPVESLQLSVNSTPPVLYVLGQTSLSGILANQGSSSPTGSTLFNPRGVLIDEDDTLWVVDGMNHRVLWFNNASSISSNGVAANGVLGQPSFFTNVPGAGAARMNFPARVVICGGSLWVSDASNNRVLRFDKNNLSPIGSAASGVIGQPDFNSTILNPVGPSELAGPIGLACNVDGLFVTDTNYRVLFFPIDQAMLPAGATATYAYGQPNLSSSEILSSSSTRFQPQNLELGDDGTLFIGERNFNRVLLMPPVPPTANLLPAVGVLGQPDFTSTSLGSGLDQLHQPTFSYYDSIANSLWVADVLNTRCLVFTDVLFKSQNDAAIDVQLFFVGQTPNVRILPKDIKGKVNNNKNEVFIRLDRIEEIHTNGTILQTVSIPTIGYNRTISVNGKQIFDFEIASPFQMKFRYSLFDDFETISNAGLTYSVQPSNLKFELSLAAFPFLASPNSSALRFHIAVDILPSATSISTTTSQNTTTFTIQSNTAMTTSITLLHACVVDGTTSTPLLNFNLTTTTTTTTNNTSSLDLVLDFPFFSSNISYDPDFSVTLSSSSTSSSGGGDGGSDDLLPLLALIALIIIPLLFLFIVAVVIVVIVVKKLLIRQAVSGAVNLPASEDEGL